MKMTGIKSDFKVLLAFPFTSPSRFKKKSFLRNPKLASESSHVGGRNAGVTKQESHCGMRMIASEKGRFSSVPLELFN